MRKNREEKAQCRTSREKIRFLSAAERLSQRFFFFFLPSNSFVNEGADECNAVRCNDGSVLCLMTLNLMPLTPIHCMFHRDIFPLPLLLSALRVVSCTYQLR